MSYIDQSMRTVQLDRTEQRAAKYISDVYVRMMIALVGAVGVAYLSLDSGLIVWGLTSLGRGFQLGIFATQILTVFAFQGAIFKMKASTAQLLFALYAVVTGLTLGIVGLIYTADSIVTVGLGSAAGFAVLIAYGKMTKRDLGPIGTFCIMALTMLMVYSLGVWAVSMFLPNAGFLAASIKIQGVIGTLVFAGITAYESQRLKKLAYGLAESAPSDATLETYVNAGALNMFMNFIGLFLSSLQLFGRRR